MNDQMKTKQSGEWIGYTYRVLDVFPFVQGVLYYSAVEGGDWGPGEDSQPTRFILAVGKWKREENVRQLTERDDVAFFPVEEAFVDEGVLYWVFRPLAGHLLAHRLLEAGSLPLGEVKTLLAAIIGHARRLVEKREFAVVDPLNILVTSEGEVRFLYGGAANRLPNPAAEIPDVEKQWVFDIAALACRMLTGQHLPVGGAPIPSLRDHRKDVPAVWDVLIRQALSSDPAERPTLARLENALLKDRGEEGEPRKADRTDDPVEPAKEGNRRPERDSSLPALHQDVSGRDTEKRLPSAETPRRGEVRKGAASGRDGKETETGVVPQTPRRSSYLVPEESPAPRERSRSSRRLWKSKGLVAALVACIVALAGLGGYQWLFAEKDPADVKPTTVFDPDVEEDPEQAAAWYRQSVEARENKQLAQAILLGRKAVSADPNKMEYYGYLAELYESAGDIQSAILLLKEGVKRFPNDAELHDQLALYAYFAKDLKTAETASDRSIQIEPDNPEFLYHRGKIFIAQGNQRTAAELIGEAVERDSDNAVYHHDLAVILFRLEEINRSIEHAEKAVQYDDSNEKYRMTLGLAYLKKRELTEKDSDLSSNEKKEQLRSLAKKAYESFHAAAELNDRYAQAYYYEAMSRYYYGDLMNARQAVERAIVLDSARASYHYQLGVILTAQGKKSEAIKALERAVELEPGNDRYKNALNELKSK